VLTELAGGVGRVAEHLGPGPLVFDKARGGLGIAVLAGAETGGSDETGLGLGSDVGLVAVPIGVLGLVDMARLGSTTETVRSGAVRSAMRQRPGLTPRLDLLAGHEGEKDGALLLLVDLETEVLGREDELVGVVYERDEPVDVISVLEVTRRASGPEIVLAHVDAIGELGHELSHSADLALEKAIVSWRWTASSSTVESRACRVFPLITPEVLITSRIASKMRWGRSDARSLMRHSTRTVG